MPRRPRPTPTPTPAPASVSTLPHAAPRSGARVSFDGKSTMDLQRGTFLLVEATRFPLPTINLTPRDLDWYEGITQKLKWNQSLRPAPRPLASAEMLQSRLDDGGSTASGMSEAFVTDSWE